MLKQTVLHLLKVWSTQLNCTQPVGRVLRSLRQLNSVNSTRF